MESRLPKPTSIKRPAQAIVPMNRIKREATATSMARPIAALEPYRDITNLTSVNGRTARPVSPDVRSNAQSRFKLRRSRSACDIIAMKKAENVGAKLPRVNEVSMTRLNNRSAMAAKTAAAALKTSTGAIAKKKPLTTQSTVKSILNSKKEPAAKPGSSATSTATTGAAKPINKRIPPYDFKARYHDLLEKHKVLKDKHQQTVEQLENFDNLPEQLEQCQTDLNATKLELETRTVENANLEQNLANSVSKLESVTTNFVKCTEELNALKEAHENLEQQYAALLEKTKVLEEANEKFTKENKYLHGELSICKEQLFRSNLERKILHNDLMDLRGNIRVFCRVRPPLSFESDKALCGWNYMDEATVEIINHDLVRQNKQGAHTFSFDYVFHPGSLQEDVFESVAPLIQSALDGYNICIFAYGQTGSGKTFTMDGIPTKVGVIPRTVDLLFSSVESYKHLGWEYTIKATFLEIYNEVLYDLLSNEQKDMEIRMATSNKNDIYVSNITEAKVETAEQLRQLMDIAKMNRATAATAGNERSSRSHAVTRIELNGFHADKNEYAVGTINLVDLAGSESPKTSQRMTETKNINRSLSELTNVILALLQKQDHIPYRNSKLTHLLMPSLGGNSKTLMFINVAPFLDCYTESLKSLRFAASVNSCKVAKAKRNRYFNTSST